MRLVREGGDSAQTPNGRGRRKMPAFANQLTDAEIGRVLSRVRTSWRNRAMRITTPQVALLRKKLKQ